MSQYGHIDDTLPQPILSLDKEHAETLHRVGLRQEEKETRPFVFIDSHANVCYAPQVLRSSALPGAKCTHIECLLVIMPARFTLFRTGYSISGSSDTLVNGVHHMQDYLKLPLSRSLPGFYHNYLLIADNLCRKIGIDLTGG